MALKSINCKPQLSGQIFWCKSYVQLTFFSTAFSVTREIFPGFANMNSQFLFYKHQGYPFLMYLFKIIIIIYTSLKPEKNEPI